MNDLATLGIAVDSSPAAKAASDLDKMTSAAERAEDAVAGLGDKSSTSLKEVGKSASSLPGVLKEVETSATGAGKAASGMVSPALISQMNQFEASLRSGAKSTGELEMQRSQLRNLQKANMIDDAEAIKINKQLDKTQQELSKSAVQQEKAMDQLMRSIDPTAAKMAKLERETEELGKLFDKGGIDAEAYGRALGQLDAKFAKLDAANDPIAKFSLSTRGAREDVMQLGNALASGDWQGAARNFQQIGVSAGGAGAALKALGGFVVGLVNPLTVAAASAAALGYIYYDAEKQVSAFNKALFSGTASSGQTASSLDAIAKSASGLSGDISSANDAVIALAGSSKLSQAQFVDLAQAASAISEYSGKGAGEVASDLANVGDSATKAAEKISAQYGLLTSAQYEVIAGLDQQGRKQEALDVLSASLNENAQRRLEQYRDSLSKVERDWNDIGTAISNAYSKVKAELFPDLKKEAELIERVIKTREAGGVLGALSVGLGKASTAFDSVLGLTDSDSTEALKKKLALIRERLGLSQQTATVEGKAGEADQIRIEAQMKWDALHKKNLFDHAKLEDDIQEARKLGLVAGKSQVEIDKEVANIQAKYDKSQPKGKAGGIDLTGFNDAENQLKAIVAEYDRSQKELDSLQKAGLVSQEDYSRQSATLIRAEKDKVAAAYQAEISALEAAKAKKGTSAEQSIQLDQKVADARANMAKAMQDSDSKLNVLQVNEQGRLDKQTAAVENYIQALNDQLETTRKQLQVQAAGVGMGDEARRRLQDDIKIQQDYQDKLDKLLAQRNKDAISQDVYDQETDAVRKALAERLQLQKDYYAAVEAEQSNWLNGATAAYQTYLEEARNVAGQTKSAFLNAFDSLEDVFVDFITTGKASFKDFANSVIADLARIVVKQQVIAPLLNAVFGGSGGSSGATSFGGAVGSMLGGSSASDSSGWGGMVGLGKNLYSAWNAVTGVGAEIMSGYASGGVSGAISGGASYYGSMLSNLGTTLAGGFNSIVGAVTGQTAAQAAAAAANAATSAALQGAVTEGAASIGANIGVGGAAQGAASAGSSSMLASMGAMWPLAVIMGMYQSGKLYDAGVRPDAGEIMDSGGKTALGKVAMAPGAAMSKMFEIQDDALGKVVGGKWAAILSGSTLHQAVTKMVGEKLFGTSYQTKDMGIQLGVEGGVFDAQQYTKQKKKGGWLSGSSKTRYLYEDLPQDSMDAFGAAYNDKILNSLGLFSALGVQLSDSVLDGLNVAATQISTQDKTPEALQTEIDAWFTGLGNSAVSAINAATNSGLEGFTFDGLTTFVNNLYEVNSVFDKFGVKMVGFSVAGGRAVEALAAIAGGMDALRTNLSSYYDNFTTDTQKSSDTLASVTQQFAALDLVLPGTRDAYKDMLQQLDMTSAYGQAVFNAMTMHAESAAAAYAILEQRSASYYSLFTTEEEKAADKLSGVTAEFAKAGVTLPDTRKGFMEMVTAASQAGDSGKGLFNSLMSMAGDASDLYTILEQRVATGLTSAMSTLQRSITAQQKAAQTAYNATTTSLNDMLSTASGNVSGLTSVGNDLSAALKALRGDSDDAVKMLRAQAQATLQSALATARSGGSLSGFTGLEDALDTVSSNNTDLYGSMEDFARDQGRTANVVAELNAINGKQLTAAEKLQQSLEEQIKLAEDNYKLLTDQFESEQAFAQAQLDALNGVDTSIMTVAAAVNAMNAAVVAALSTLPRTGAGSAVANTPQNNATHVETIYQSVLGRDTKGDEAGAAFWAAQLQSGAMGYDQIAAAIAQGAFGNGAESAATKAKAGKYLGLPGYATGGLISGPGTGTSDSILSRLSNGEYVMSADAVRMFGTGLLDQMNAGRLPAFATGGGVGENGPQLAVTAPSRIYNANQTASMRSGGDRDSKLERKVDTLIDVMKQIMGPMKIDLNKNRKLFEKFDNEGLPPTRKASASA